MESHRELQHLEPYAGFLSLCQTYYTRTAYTQVMRIWKAFLDQEGLTVAQAGGSDVLRFVGILGRPGTTPTGRERRAYSAETQIHALSTLKKFYRYLMAVRFVTDNPTLALEIVKIRRPQRKPRALHPLERIALLNALRVNSRKNFAISLAVRLAFECGLRVGEIARIQVKDLDLTQGILRVIGKGDKERILPLTEILREWLAAWLERGGIRVAAPLGFNVKDRQPLQNPASPAFLFPNIQRRQDGHVGAHVINRWMKVAARWAGIPTHLTVHVLRHTFGTQLAETGASAYEIRDLLGHSTTQMTETYVDLASDSLRRAHARAFSTGGIPSREIPAKTTQQEVA